RAAFRFLSAAVERPVGGGARLAGGARAARPDAQGKVDVRLGGGGRCRLCDVGGGAVADGKWWGNWRARRRGGGGHARRARRHGRRLYGLPRCPPPIVRRGGRIPDACQLE